MKKLVVGTGKSGLGVGKYLRDINIEFDYFDDVTENDKVLNKPIIKDIFDIGPKINEYDEMIISPGVAIDSEIVKLGKKNGLSIIGEFELAFRASNKKIIGITGTNGKTTTTALIGHIIGQTEKVEIVGNIGVPFIEKFDAEPDVYVAEISSFQLETIDTMKPNIAVIMNVTPDHLDRHHTFDNYISTKMKITENQDENDFLLINADCFALNAYNIQSKAKKVYFSKECKVDGAYIKDGKIFMNGDKICDTSDIKLVGKHNLENVLAAVAVCYLHGVVIDKIKKGVSTFKAVKHRLQFVAEINGVKYFNDSKGTNPDAAIQAVASMEAPTLLIAGGYDKHSDYTEWLNIAKRNVKKLILMGETAKDIYSTAIDIGYNEDDLIMVNSMKEAVSFCKDKAEEGEIVLLSPACASWGMYRNYEERGDDFINLVGEAYE